MTTERECASVLIVEDPFVRHFVGFVLGREGYHVLETEPRRAAEVLASKRVEISVIVTNDPRPFKSWADRIGMVYVAAAPDSQLANAFPHCRVLRKPFQPKELLDAVQELTVHAL